MTTIPTFALNDGSSVPAIGFGTYPLRGREGTDATLSAIDAGYRLIDTAVNYRNEDAVGAAVRETDVPRDELVVATKLPGRDHGFEETITSCRGSLASLGLDHIDLYLIHWPNPSVGRFVESWKAMIQLQREGLVRSIGVSNFTEEFLTRLADETGVLPAVNQVELHPYFPQEELLAFHREHGIVTEAWSPLGKAQAPFAEESVAAAAAAHDVSPAQVASAGTTSAACSRSRSPRPRNASARTSTSSASSSATPRCKRSPHSGGPTAGSSTATPTPTRRCESRRARPRARRHPS
ncbi:Aldo/keto reductase [Plantibacter sp. VKM Ac-1784]|uniref:Aldo/keto reductase n=1 Tax=Plantibacter elymi (nom. nud.) TaxID=199708 RepID=A0ABY1RGV7_9MICO|nr:Aldo/keto reductase [Plantibacter sp. VKM Ac-1784]